MMPFYSHTKLLIFSSYVTFHKLNSEIHREQFVVKTTEKLAQIKFCFTDIFWQCGLSIKFSTLVRVYIRNNFLCAEN